MPLEYDFVTLDEPLNKLDASQTIQRCNLYNLRSLSERLQSDSENLVQRVLANRQALDLSRCVATFAARLRRWNAAARRMLAKRSRRLSAMRVSLRLAIMWDKVERVIRGSRGDWRG